MNDKLCLAIVCHLVADWIFQNDWIAKNKGDLRHIAGWTHGMIHFALMTLVFPIGYSIIISLLHILIDTRRPVLLWQKIYGQTTEGVYATHVAIWVDQVVHIAILAICTALL